MNIECDQAEPDEVVGHLMDTLVMQNMAVDALVEPVVYVLADLLAQATNAEPDLEAAEQVCAMFLECYRFCCSQQANNATISIQ